MFKFIVSIVFLFFSCTPKTDFNSSYVFGVVYSDFAAFNQTIIAFYDEYGRILQQIKVPIGGVDNGFSIPQITEKGLMYLPAMGTYSKSENKILELNLHTGETQIYTIGYGITSIHVDENYLYAVNWPLKGSVVTKFNIAEKRIEVQKKIDHYTIQHLRIVDNQLYLFARLDEEFNQQRTSMLFIMDKNNLTIQSEKNLSIKNGFQQDASWVHQDRLFFNYNLIPKIINEAQQGSNFVGELNLKTKHLRLHSLQIDYPYHFGLYKHQLVISHHNVHEQHPKAITLLDLSSNNQKTYILEEEVREFHIQNDYLYTLNKQHLLRKYQLPEFKPVYWYELKLPLKWSEKVPSFEKYAVASHFFLNPKND